MSKWEKCLSNPHFVFILKISCTLELEVRDPDSGGREGWSWRPGGFGWLAAPWTQVDRSGQSPECPPLSARPLSPPQPPPPRSQEASVGPRSETGQFVDLEHCLGLERANLSKPKTDLRIFHMTIVASTRLKQSNFLPWQEKSLSYPRALKSPLSLANCHE